MRTCCTCVVTGQVTRKDNREPIHGLLIKAWGVWVKPWHDKVLCRVCLGSDLTNRDGSFSIPFREECLPQPCEGKPEVHLKVFDRDGRLIYDVEKKACTCEEDCSWVFELCLPPDLLECHLSRPLSWECLDDPLVSRNVMEEIREALDLVAHPQKPGYVARLKALLCTEPPLSIFDNIMSDAWSTLQGDLDAAARYHDILEALCSCRAGECCIDKEGCYTKIIDDIFEQVCCEDEPPCPSECEPEQCEDEPSEECEPKQCEEETPCPSEECEPERCEPPCPYKDSLISSDKATILIMAALHLSCRHTKTAKAHLGALLDQICRFQFLASLHRSAVKALCGDTQAKSHFRDLLEFVGTKCQPDDKNFPPFPVRDPFPCCETCLSEEFECCLRDAVRAWCRIECYTVTAVEPERACPGDKIVIFGRGFGDVAGDVVFYEKGTTRLGPVVKPETGCDAEVCWCDDKICVVVPEDAGCGLVPRLPADTVSVCDRFIQFHPTGCIKSGFEGTSAEILKFIVKDHINNECLLPGEPLRIRWKTCAADKVRVEIIDAKSGALIDKIDPADARGKWDFLDTHFNKTTHVGVRITAEGKCKPREVVRTITFIFQKPANLSVDGMEVTQAIQYYRAAQHLTDPADRGPDNSLQLVTNKTAWVRVYLRSGQDPLFDNGQVPDVDGTLTVERRVNNVWSVVANLPSQNGPVTADDAFVSYDAERSNINSSLNFVVPASIMTGLLRFRVNVSSSFVKCGNGSDTDQTTVDVNLTQTLNAAFITIGYNGPNAARTGNLNLPAPTLAQCQAETAWAMTTYPVSGNPNVRIAGTFITNTPLDDARSCAGCCSPNWNPLLQQVANIVTADQAANPGGNWVYYGIINAGIPVNVPGCNGVATGGLAGRPLTYAHEIGHQFGLPHARCGNVGGGNAAYPVYEPYDLPVDPAGTANWTMASIGEYGLNINNGNIANPNTAEDFMSYCGPRWISLFTHNILVNALGLVPQVIPTGAGGAERVIRDEGVNDFVRDPNVIEPLVHILGSVDEEGEVDVASVARLDGRYSVAGGRQTNYFAQLLDENGNIIAQDPLYGFENEGSRRDKDKGGCAECDGDRDFMFKAMLNDYAPGACLRIVQGRETVWERNCPADPPVLSKVRAALDKDGRVSVSWVCKTAAKTKEDIWIRRSNDDGKTWNALTVVQKASSVKIDADHLPGGEVRFQILAHDGFFTTSETTDVVKLAPKAPTVSILYPGDKDLVYAERLLHLWGTASAGVPVSDERFVWYIDEREVAKGRDIWVENPGAGKHAIRLEVSDEQDQTGVATSNIEVLKT